MASFFDRIGAFFIDAIIVSLFLAVIGYNIPSNNEVSTKINELETKLVSNEASSDEIIDEYKDLVYDYQKSMILSSSVTVLVYVAYYVVFQYMNNGQSFGKKVLKIKVVSLDESKASVIQMFLRYLFIMNIFSGIVNIILLYILPKDNYYISYLSFSAIETIFMIISLLFILYRKDKRGLHDLMARTKVIKEV